MPIALQTSTVGISGAAMIPEALTIEIITMKTEERIIGEDMTGDLVFITLTRTAATHVPDELISLSASLSAA